MRIVYPYQTVMVRRPLRGLGALCDYTPGCACKGEVEPLYEDAERVRNEIDSLMGRYPAFVPEWIKTRHNEQNRQFSKIRDNFNAADESCYGNWRTDAVKGKLEYEKTLKALNAHLTTVADKINAAGGDGGGGTSPDMPSLFGPTSPIIPGTSAELNPWIIAGAVGIALFVGYKLTQKV